MIWGEWSSLDEFEGNEAHFQPKLLRDLTPSCSSRSLIASASTRCATARTGTRARAIDAWSCSRRRKYPADYKKFIMLKCNLLATIVIGFEF